MKKRKAEEENVQNKKKITTEQDPSKMDKEHKEKKKEILKEVEEMDEVDQKAVGTFFLSLKEMRKAAKLNLRQGCQAPINTKFPVFSLCSCHFPCVFLSTKTKVFKFVNSFYHPYSNHFLSK